MTIMMTAIKENCPTPCKSARTRGHSRTFARWIRKTEEPLLMVVLS